MRCSEISGQWAVFLLRLHYVTNIAGLPATGRSLSSRVIAESQVIATEPTYRAVQEPDYSWTVIVVETGLAYCVQGFPMALLREEVALALADALNMMMPEGMTIH